jgi:hypothetical protein
MSVAISHKNDGIALRVQQYFSYIQGGCFYWCRKPDPPEYPEKTTDLPQVIEGIPIASKVNALCIVFNKRD